MARKPAPHPPCPHCGATHVVRNGSKGGRPRWVCRVCRRSFGPTWGTPLYRLRTDLQEIARTLPVVMRRGSRSATEEITGHKYETIGRWLRMAARQAEAIPQVLVHDPHRSPVEVDAFWSFVKKASGGWRSGRLGGRGGPAWGMLESGSGDSFGGGVGLWVFGGRGRAEGGGADPPAPIWREGGGLDPRWATGRSTGGSSRRPGRATDGKAGASAPGAHARGGVDSGRSAPSSGPDCGRGGPSGSGGTGRWSRSGA